MATKEQLARIIQGRASALCSPEGERMIDSHSRNHQQTNESKTVYTDIPKPDYNYDTNYDDIDTLSESKMSPKSLNYSDESAQYSNMPEAIKQSMIKNRIDVSSLGEGGQTSFLDEVAIANQKPKRRIVESQQQLVGSGTIDYALIKSIVMECLQESNKRAINESSSLKTIKLSGGNIKLVDNSGNVYSAKLEKLGNLNDKKK